MVLSRQGGAWRCLWHCLHDYLEHRKENREHGRLRAAVVWLCEGCARVSRNRDGVMFTHDQMRARACIAVGRFGLWRFTYNLTIQGREQTRRAHAMRRSLQELVLQLPLEVA